MDVVLWIRQVDGRIVDHLQSSSDCSEKALLRFNGLAGGRFLLDSCRRAGLLPWPKSDEATITYRLTSYAELEPRWIGRLLRQFWRWVLKPRAEEQSNRTDADPTLKSYVTQLRVAAEFLIFVAARGDTVTDICQQVLDASLDGKPIFRRRKLQPFIKWLAFSGIVRNALVLRVSPNTADVMSRSRYFELVHRAATGSDIPDFVRVILGLLLQTAHSLADILRLKRDSVYRDKRGVVRIEFRRGKPWAVEGTLADLLWSLRSKTGSWLFLSPQVKGRPIHPATVRDYILRSGIKESARDMRVAGLRELSVELGAGEAVHLLGANIYSEAGWRDRFGPSRAEKLTLARLGNSPSRVGLIGVAP